MSTLFLAPLTDTEVATATAAGAGMSFVFGLIAYAVSALVLMGVFKKAGKPAWAAWVPIYNTIVLLEVVGRPVWWFVLLLVPFVNIAVLIIVMNDLSKSFGQGVGFTVGLVLLPVIFLAILGYGSSDYRGPAAAAGAPSTGYAA